MTTKKQNPPAHDFGGYATRTNVECTDGRTILSNAFKENDGQVVPLVWQHGHDQPTNVLGHALLENRDDGVYAFGFFNESENAKHAKTLIQHGDIKSLSIYANSLVEKSKKVIHGVIREVSLVMAGANPGAKIDYVALLHGDGEYSDLEDEAIIYSGLELDGISHEDAKEDVKETEGEEDLTIAEIFETLDEKQKTAVYAIVGQILEKETDSEETEVEQSSIEQGDKVMKSNVFEGSAIQKIQRPILAHADFKRIQDNAKKVGSLRTAFMADEKAVEFLAHAGTYGIGSDRANLELLFPDAQNVTGDPTWISRDMAWVSRVINGTRHTPFSRLKSLHADITADEARARGYITGNQKIEEVFPILRRITTPTTVYKKQKLDRDDIIDITDFDVVRWLKAEMRLMLDEEIARATLIGDGRDPVLEADDHINTDNIRPIWTDSTVYAYHHQVGSALTTDELIDEMIKARVEYRGSGSPTLFAAPTFITEMLLLRDLDGRRLYRSLAELAAEISVESIVEVPVMENQSRTDDLTDYDLKGIIVNLRDYSHGADKGGSIAFFDDFDIDYNQYKYLIETRLCGALTLPKSAIVLEQEQAGD